MRGWGMEPGAGEAAGVWCVAAAWDVGGDGGAR